MSLRKVSLFVFGLFSAAMLGLAAGASWMVLTMRLGHLLPWLVLPFGAVLAWAVRQYVHAAGPAAALLAAWATMLAAIYVNMLIAGVMIASNMDMGILDALHTAGLGMLWQLTRLALSPMDIGWIALAMLLAATLAWWTPRKR